MIGMILRTIRPLALITVLTGCVVAPTPGVSPDLLAAEAAADPVRSLELMREQGERFAHTRFLPGNQVHLLINGPASFGALAAGRVRQRGGNRYVAEVVNGHAASMVIWAGSTLMTGVMSSAIGSVCI